MRDERHFPRIALQRVEGGAIGGVQRERGEELPARLDLHASRERRAPRANPLGHLALDLRLERLERRRRRGVPRPDREGDLELVHRSAEIARALERGRLLDVARDEGPPRVRRWRRRAEGAGRRRRRHPRAGRLGLLPRRRAGAERERQQKACGADRPRSAHFAGSTSDSRWYTFRFLAKSSSVISE